MDFPEHIELILDRAGMRAATKAALYELYASLGSPVLDLFADVAEEFPSVAEVEPEDIWKLKLRVVEAYVRRWHPAWMRGEATPSLWCPRELEGRASGLLLPMGIVGVDAVRDESLGDVVDEKGRALLGDGQAVPSGTLIFGKNAHYGGRLETVSFDIITSEIETAVACALAEGRQHTVPGSVGETSGTVDSASRALLIWETQPNVLKPQGERNREIARLWRRHRNWHVATLSAAVLWGLRQRLAIFVLRGSALVPTHEVNEAIPVAEEVVIHHDRTVRRVVEGLGAELIDPSQADASLVQRSALMNHGLTTYAASAGVPAAMWRVSLTS